MSSPLHSQLTGQYTAAAAPAPISISLPSGYDKFEIVNITDIGVNNAGSVAKAQGYSLFPAGSAFYSTIANATTLNAELMTLTNGFTFVTDSGQANNVPGGAAITGITNVVQPVVSSVGAPATGQVVRLFNTTGALQLAGMDYTITNTGANAFNLTYVATAPGSAGTAGTYAIVPTDGRYYPRWRYITGIAASPSNAANTTIALSVTHGYTVGQQVKIEIPITSNGTSPYGMYQMNGLQGTIVAIGETFPATAVTNTITVNINIAGFTAFTFATSAVAATGVSFPIVVPMGEMAVGSILSPTTGLLVPVANVLDDRTRNISFTGVTIGTTLQTASKTYQWIATKGVTMSPPLIPS